MKKLLFIPRWLSIHPWVWFAFIVVLLPAGFTLDRYSSLAGQWLLSFVVWWLLIGVLTTRNKSDRILILTLVVVATGCEFLATFVLHLYTYRLHNVPAWIPPAHGIIFFTAFLWSEQIFAKRHELKLKIGVGIGAAGYCLVGLVRPHADIAGALYGAIFLMLLLLTGHSKSRFYTILWFYVCYLELWGVFLGTWHWSPYITHLGLSQGNPPSGIVGLYGGFDLIAFVLASAIKRSSLVRDEATITPN